MGSLPFRSSIIAAGVRRLVLGIAALVLPVAAATVDVELVEIAHVETRTIRLKDVAQVHSSLEGESLKALEQVNLGVIGDGRAALRLDANRVARMIALQQPALSGWVKLTGAPAVVVDYRDSDGPNGSVRRGERVKVVARNGAVVVEQYAVALASAMHGQTVRVRSPAAGTVVSGRVVGGVVEMEQ